MDNTQNKETISKEKADRNYKKTMTAFAVGISAVYLVTKAVKKIRKPIDKLTKNKEQQE